MSSVILILADDLGYSDVGYHSERAYTPNIDQMANSDHSVVLDRFYANSPVCSPTRASLLTGRNPNRYCIWNANSKKAHSAKDFAFPSLWPLPTEETTIAELLNKVEVESGVFGKWHLGDLKPLKEGNEKWPQVSPSECGFSDWNVTIRSTPTYHPNCGCFNTECRRGTFSSKLECTNYYSQDVMPYDQLIGDDNEFIGDLAENFIRQHANKPFFLYLPFHTAHTDYIGTEFWTQFYRDRGLSENSANYYAAISGMDEQVGRIRDLISELNIDVMLWFTSDNGPSGSAPANFSAFRGNKGDLYEGGLRVPTIVEWPKHIHTNRRVDRTVATSLDFLPTVSDLWDIKPNNPLDGKSLLPLLINDTQNKNSGVGFAYDLEKKWSGGEWQMVWIRDEWKWMKFYYAICVGHLCVDIPIDKKLFNLVIDPTETSDFSSSQGDLKVDMDTELQDWFIDVLNSAEELDCVLGTTMSLELFFILIGALIVMIITCITSIICCLRKRRRRKIGEEGERGEEGEEGKSREKEESGEEQI